MGITHEPGLKTRYFAAPNQLVQRTFQPLKEALLTSLRQFFLGIAPLISVKQTL